MQLLQTAHVLAYIIIGPRRDKTWGFFCNLNASKINNLQRRACKLFLGNDYTTLEAALKQLRIYHLKKRGTCIKRLFYSPFEVTKCLVTSFFLLAY